LGKYADINSLELDLNAALQSRVPNGIQKGKNKIAIDFNLIPYYGKPSPLEEPYIYRSQAKSDDALSPEIEPAFLLLLRHANYDR